MDLDALYQKTIDDQRAHLLELQEVFNKACDSAKEVAQEKLKKLTPDDKAGREEILKEQKETLETALRQLKEDIGESTRSTMKKLEEIMRHKEEKILADLEKQLASL